MCVRAENGCLSTHQQRAISARAKLRLTLQAGAVWEECMKQCLALLVHGLHLCAMPLWPAGFWGACHSGSCCASFSNAACRCSVGGVREAVPGPARA